MKSSPYKIFPIGGRAAAKSSTRSGRHQPKGHLGPVDVQALDHQRKRRYLATMTHNRKGNAA
jgi:hypothetical protein